MASHDKILSLLKLKHGTEIHKLKIRTGGVFVRKGHSIVLKNEAEALTADEFEILRIKQQDGQQWVSSAVVTATPEQQAPTTESNDKNAWIVVKSLANTSVFQKGYKLKEKDVVKLGRVRFRVKEICVDSKKKPNLQFEEHNANIIADQFHTPEVTDTVCRICLSNNTSQENPLVNPCLCGGSMKYVHIGCLQQWLKSRIQTRDTEVAFTIAWKNLNCEICKKTYPYSIQSGTSTFYPLELPTSNAESYITFEVLSKENNQVRGLHFINLNSKPLIKLGRGHESDVRVSDISVSRYHANIRLENGGVYLTDNNSKFGTLIQLKSDFPLIGDLDNITLQIGRTALTFNIGSGRKSSPKASASMNSSQSLGVMGDASPVAGNAGIFDFNNNKNGQNFDDEVNVDQNNANANINNNDELGNIEDLLYPNNGNLFAN